MRGAKTRQSIVAYALLALLAVGVSILVGGWAVATTTEGLVLQAIGAEKLAGAGNNEEAAVVVSVYNAAGPVGGLPGGSFSITAVIVAPGGTEVTKVRVMEIAGSSGVYRIDMVPTKASVGWLKGTYIIAVTLTSTHGSGVAIAELAVDP